MNVAVHNILIISLLIPLCLGRMDDTKSHTNGMRKNVLFLVADDMRPQLTAYRGKNYPVPVSPEMHTPNLDQLASHSLLLERAYVQQAYCGPSRASLLTGRRPDTTHVYDCKTYFRNVGGNFTTIPQYFKQNGYVSVGMGKVFHQGEAAGNDDPVSWSDTYFHGVDNFESHEKTWEAIPEAKLRSKPLIDRQIADHAIKTLERLAPKAETREQPFFLAVGFRKPHLPFVFPERFLNYYPEDKIHLPENPYAPVNLPKIAYNKCRGIYGRQDIKSLHVSGAMNTTLPDNTVLKLRRAYYAAVSWTDSLIGEVLAKLDDLGLTDNTIVSFWGDHGWQLGEHNEWCKQTNFELATHAPMMIHIPGKTDLGIKTEQLTEFVDLFPTLVEAADLPPLELCPVDSTGEKLCREGKSMMPLIENPNVAIKGASFSQYPRGTSMGYTIRTDRYRYTAWPQFNHKPEYKPNWKILAGVELYDHAVDPQENYNRAYDRKYKNIRGQLHTMLIRGWRNALPGNSEQTPNLMDVIDVELDDHNLDSEKDVNRAKDPLNSKLHDALKRMLDSRPRRSLSNSL